ncbi:hypothetical protein PSAB6_50041 [Paraburkholderia sabiae]|uniref:gamma-mobile-trio protein GmtX n=1 Tax=Paraburkholderia sabiae TaxID=273251 RepID=UPI001CAD665A|nr:gamma-mobile-trio protein GmtX [Paraburkholderia sabiae]CAG9228578.1 hypothetical protein PSAB6_50041 [Paraburkholderia sabiae]
MHPDEVYEEIRARSGARKLRSLEVLHAVCREQCENGSRDFSAATIARLGAPRGGPAAQTIHNQTGDDYKLLMRAWLNHAGGSPRKGKNIVPDSAEDFLSRIREPEIRYFVGTLLAANTKLRGEVKVLKQNANVVIDRRKAETAPTAPNTVQVLPASHGLTPTERDALRDAISDARFSDEGWTGDEHGRVFNSKGRPIFRIGFITAIRKILGS